VAVIIDEDLAYRLKDLSDALHGSSLERERFDAAMDRLIQAVDHLGAAAIGVAMADQLTRTEELQHVALLFGQRDGALDTAALTLVTVSVHSALDLCAGALLAVVDGRIPSPGDREAGIPHLMKRSKGGDLSVRFQGWLDDTVRDGRYAELDELWRDPQTHRPVPRAVHALAEKSSTGQLIRGSVRVYQQELVGDPPQRVDRLLGTAAEKLPGFLGFGEERFLALQYALIQTYAPGWGRNP
jgi:hypothetical protein